MFVQAMEAFADGIVRWMGFMGGVYRRFCVCMCGYFLC